MLVRLLKACQVVLKDIGPHWHAAGAEVEIPDEHFDPNLHVDITPAIPTPAAAEPNTSEPSQEDSSEATGAPDSTPTP